MTEVDRHVRCVHGLRAMHFRDFSFGTDTQLMRVMDFNIHPKRLIYPFLPITVNQRLYNITHWISTTPDVTKAKKNFKRKVTTTLLVSRPCRLWRNNEWEYRSILMDGHRVIAMKVRLSFQLEITTIARLRSLRIGTTKQQQLSWVYGCLRIVIVTTNEALRWYMPLFLYRKASSLQYMSS